jgi:hypothetical protein
MLPADLIPQRVLNLESEVAKLQRRIAQLEALTPGIKPTPTVGPAPLAAAPASLKPTPLPTPPPPPVIVVPPPPLAQPRPTFTPQPPPLPRAPRPPSALHELLGALQLLPPTGGSHQEAQIGGWWATRIGALLAVIGVVFFGVYISAHTAPGVKWLELAAIATAVTGGGFWLERKALRVGPVLVGAGLALIFFTAFAAYAVRPVQIVHSPAIAGLLQAAAVALIGFVAWRRSSPTTATMAVLLGFVSAFFSLHAGFSDLTGVAGIVLALAAVGFRLSRGWSAPLYCSVLLSPLLLSVLAADIWNRPAVHHGPVYIYGSILASFIAHLLPALREGARGEGHVAPTQNRIQAINTALSVLVGFIATNTALPQVELAHYFFGAGLILVATTLWAWRAVPQNGLFSLFAVKAASLLALGAIAQWDARTRWVALIVEAIVLLAAAQRTDRNSLRITALIAWFVSLLFFVVELPELRDQMWSPSGLAVLLYLGASLSLLHWFTRLAPNHTHSSSGTAGTLGAVAAIPLFELGKVTAHESWAILANLGLALGFGAFAWRFRSRVAIPGAILATVFAHLNVHAFPEAQYTLNWLWFGTVPLVVLSLIAAYRLSLKPLHVDPESSTAINQQFGLQLVLVLPAVLALSGALGQTVATNLAVACTSIVTVSITGLGLRLPRPAFAIAGMMSFTLAYFFFSIPGVGSPPSVGSALWLGFAITCVPVLWILGARLQSTHRTEVDAAHWIIGLAAVPLIWTAARDHLSLALTPLSVLLLGGLFSMMASRLRIGAAYATASALGLMVAFWFTTHHQWARTESAPITLAALFALALGIAAQPLFAQRRATWLSSKITQSWRIGQALVAAWLITHNALYSRAPWQDYGSVLWALGGIALFAIGLMGRARSHRITGLVLLGLCIPRIFIHDIEEAKHRIAAFIVLGLLLLWVGFSYQKFRHLIDGKPNNQKTHNS